MDDETLVQALRAAGHSSAADAVRDSALASQLREAGHEHLAEALAAGTTPAPPEPPAKRTAKRAQGDELVAVIKRDTGRDFDPPEAA